MTLAGSHAHHRAPWPHVANFLVDGGGGGLVCHAIVNVDATDL
jgi:hypothetical protein